MEIQSPVHARIEKFELCIVHMFVPNEKDLRNDSSAELSRFNLPSKLKEMKGSKMQ